MNSDNTLSEKDSTVLQIKKCCNPCKCQLCLCNLPRNVQKGYTCTLLVSLPVTRHSNNDTNPLLLLQWDKHIRQIKRYLLLHVASVQSVIDVERLLERGQVVLQCRCSVEEGNLSIEQRRQFQKLCLEATQRSGYMKTSCIQAYAKQETNALPKPSLDEYVLSKFDVEGMTCSSCASSISKVLLEIDGVSDVSVTLMTRIVAVKHLAKVQAESLQQSIESLGFGTMLLTNGEVIPSFTEATLLFTITGMTCTSCVASIEKHLRSIGVKSVSVNLLSHTGMVEIDAAKHSARDILEAISNLGYHAELINKGSAEDKIKKKVMEEETLLKKRFVYCLYFAMPTFVISMVGMMLLPKTYSFHQWLVTEIIQGMDVGTLISLLLATPIQFGLILPFYRSAYKSIRFARVPNMDVLISLGTLTAYLSSWVSVIYNLMQQKVVFATFFETPVFILTFIYFGKYLEAMAKKRTTFFMTDLLSNRTDRAIVVKIKNLTDETLSYDCEREMDTALLCVGDIVKVPVLRTIPCDGFVLSGETTVDEAMLTGEPRAIFKSKGAEVFAGSVNLTSTVYIRANRVNSDTVLQKICKLVQDAQSQKANIQLIADVVSKWFVWIVMVLSVADFLTWACLGWSGLIPVDWLPEGTTTTMLAVKFTTSVLVIACPCALGLATPTAVMVGSGIASKAGILIKSGGLGMETASSIDAIVFDKTGTLTRGQPKVTQYKLLDPKYMNVIQALTRHSEHPLSKALKGFSEQQAGVYLEFLDVADHIEIPGKGIQGEIDGQKWILGSEDWIIKSLKSKQNSTFFNMMPSKLKEEGFSISLLAKSCQDNSFEVVGLFALCDRSRPESAFVISELKRKDIEVFILSGDAQKTAEAIALEVGIPLQNVYGNVSPDKKAEQVRLIQKTAKRVQRKSIIPAFLKRTYIQLPDCEEEEFNRIMVNSKVAMVGDGVNDSIALAQADLGISMGCGSDLALSTADVLLLKSDLTDILKLLRISRLTVWRIYGNFFWAAIYNVAAIPLAAGVFYPYFRLQLDPSIAGLAMALSSVSVILSSLFLQMNKI